MFLAGSRFGETVRKVVASMLLPFMNWNMGAHDFNSADAKVKDSWARGVQWELTRMRYRDYLGRERSTGNYTLVVADMIDNTTTDDRNNGFKFNEGDKVQGYSIRQIEDALRGKHKWHTRRDNIKNRYNNGTEGHLNKLFAAYE